MVIGSDHLNCLNKGVSLALLNNAAHLRTIAAAESAAERNLFGGWRHEEP